MTTQTTNDSPNQPDLYTFAGMDPQQRAALYSSEAPQYQRTASNASLPPPSYPTYSSSPPQRASVSSGRRPSLFEKLKSSLTPSRPPTDAEVAEASEQTFRRESDAFESRQRIERMRVGVKEANRTGIPQWVGKDEYGCDMYVEGNLGKPKGWTYPEGAYNIRTGPATRVKGMAQEGAVLGNIVGAGGYI